MATLGDPIVIRRRTVKNRILMPPMVCFGWAGGDGRVSDRHIAHYAARAEAGVGLIVIEAACVREDGRLSPSQLGLWEDGQIEGFTALARACHDHGSIVLVQIHHGGIHTHPACGQPVSPHPWEGDGISARGLTRQEIDSLRQDFIAAAVRAQKAGLDGIQVHGCHGYLLNAFSNARINRRTDEYGGDDPVNRTRLAREIMTGIREACGEDFIIAIRAAGFDPTLEDGLAAISQYQPLADLICVSNGMGDLSAIPVSEDFPFSPTTYLGARAKALVSGAVPVSAVGGIRTPEQAEALVAGGYADMAEVGRSLLCDPDWTRAALSGQPPLSCLGCNPCSWSTDGDRCPRVIQRRKASKP